MLVSVGFVDHLIRRTLCFLSSRTRTKSPLQHSSCTHLQIEPGVGARASPPSSLKICRSHRTTATLTISAMQTGKDDLQAKETKKTAARLKHSRRNPRVHGPIPALSQMAAPKPGSMSPAAQLASSCRSDGSIASESSKSTTCSIN